MAQDVRTVGDSPTRARANDTPDLARTDSKVQRVDDSNSSDTGADVEDKGPADQPAEKDPFEVGWNDGVNDPLNPRGFTLARKWLIVSITAICSFCVTGASSIYTSTYEQMEAEFGNSRIVSVLGLSMFVLGISLGPMLLGPLSEFYGRRPIYLVAWSAYVIWIIPQAVAPNIETMIVCRFLDGFAGSAFLTVAGGTVGDLFDRAQLQLPMAVFSVAPFIGPSTGPVIGGFINYHVDWRWTYYVLLIWSFVMWLAIVFAVPETHHPTLWSKKARGLRKETGDERWMAASEKVTRSVVVAVGHSLLRPFQLLIFEPMCLSLDLYSAILLGTLYLFFGAFPLVFSETYGFNLWQVGLTFLGIFAGMLIGISTDSIWHAIRNRLIEKHSRETGIAGNSEPEFRLPPLIVGCLLVPVGIFMFGWSAYPHVHWIVPIIGSTLFGTGVLLAFTGIFTFLVDAYPLYAASALAANAFVRCAFAAAFPLFGTQMYNALGIQWASSLLAFLAVAMIPFPYLFFRYGKQLRSKSRFATG